MSFLRQAAKQIVTMAVPRRMLVDRGPSSGERAPIAAHSGRSVAEIALTFDDGPRPEHTLRLLDWLAGDEVLVTLFVPGTVAWSHPDLVRRIVADGHETGNRTYTHASLEHAYPQLPRAEVGTTTRAPRRSHREPMSTVASALVERTFRQAIHFSRISQYMA